MHLVNICISYFSSHWCDRTFSSGYPSESLEIMRISKMEKGSKGRGQLPRHHQQHANCCWRTSFSWGQYSRIGFHYLVCISNRSHHCSRSQHRAACPLHIVLITAVVWHISYREYYGCYSVGVSLFLLLLHVAFGFVEIAYAYIPF